MADPDKAPRPNNATMHVLTIIREWGVMERGLLQYSQAPGDNPLDLCPAYEHYENVIYRRLVDQLGIGKTSRNTPWIGMR